VRSCLYDRLQILPLRYFHESKPGDSLAGRHFQFLLHPLDMKEALALADRNLKLDKR